MSSRRKVEIARIGGMLVGMAAVGITYKVLGREQRLKAEREGRVVPTGRSWRRSMVPNHQGEQLQQGQQVEKFATLKKLGSKHVRAIDHQGFDVYLVDTKEEDLPYLLEQFINGSEVWPWIWTWPNANGPHHVFVGVNKDTIGKIKELAQDSKNNIMLIASEEERNKFASESFYSETQCGLIDSAVKLFNMRHKMLMTEDERVLCFDSCTFSSA